MYTFDFLDHSQALVANQIHELMQASYSVEANLIGASSFPPLRRGLEQVQISDSKFIGCFSNGALIGLAELEGARGKEVIISSLCVHPSYFRHGVATGLLTEILRLADGSTISVSTAELNEPAIKLYTKFGFGLAMKNLNADGFHMVTLFITPQG